MKKEQEPLFPILSDLPQEVVEKDFGGTVEMFFQAVGRKSRRTYQRLCRTGNLPAILTKDGYRIKTADTVAILREENRKAERDLPFRKSLIERLEPTVRGVREYQEPDKIGRHSLVRDK